MTTNIREFDIAVIPGDGIGVEIMDACLDVLRALEEITGGYRLHTERIEAGAGCYRDTGEDMSAEAFAKAGEADAILLGAIGDPAIRYPDGTEISPHLRLRTAYNLIAGLRPIKTYPSIPTPLGDPRAADIDFVIVRESTEGLFASVGKGTVEDDRRATETLVITRDVCEPLFDMTFALARSRKKKGRSGQVTCVDKANVFSAMAFFRKIFDERASAAADIETNHLYVDAAALNMVRNPWDFDVIVTENMYGDILSDLGAGIVGSMGLAPCAEIGETHGLFQPAHGSAPDIAGTGKANPTAMFLSAAMMLDWLGERHGVGDCGVAAERLNRAVDRTFAKGGLLPCEFGGGDGTAAIAEAVIGNLD